MHVKSIISNIILYQLHMKMEQEKQYQRKVTYLISYESEIVWKFDKFEPKVTQAAKKKENGQAFNKQEKKKQIDDAIKNIIQHYADKANPFSLIDSINGLQIIDSKWLQINKKSKQDIMLEQTELQSLFDVQRKKQYQSQSQLRKSYAEELMKRIEKEKADFVPSVQDYNELVRRQQWHQHMIDSKCKQQKRRSEWHQQKFDRSYIQSKSMEEKLGQICLRKNIEPDPNQINQSQLEKYFRKQKQRISLLSPIIYQQMKLFDGSDYKNLNNLNNLKQLPLQKFPNKIEYLKLIDVQIQQYHLPKFGPFKERLQQGNKKYEPIDSFDYYLIESWRRCQHIIYEKGGVDLKPQISKKNKIFLIDNRVQLNSMRYFAVQSGLEIKKQLSLDDHHHKIYQSQAKFHIFNEKSNFELHLNLTFRIEESQKKVEKNQKDLQKKFTINKLKCIAKIIDDQDFLKGKFKNLLNFSFNAHGDYVEYPFREPYARKRKFMKQRSYSLVFQGGGAKGVAYVGSYQAIKEMKIDGLEVPITSIMGSSAGGIIALAISTGIEPYEVQKLCYKMRLIPKNDRIDLRNIQANEDNIETRKKKVLTAIKKLLSQYGLIHQQTINCFAEHFSKFDSKNLYKKLVALISAGSESIGQIFKQSQNQLNYLGLLLEGALMKGQAIHDIGAQCLVKFVLSKFHEFRGQSYENELGNQLSSDLRKFVRNFDDYCIQTLNIPIMNIRAEKRIKVIFTIINKVFMIANRNFKRYYQGNVKLILNNRFASQLLENFYFNQIYLDQNLKLPKIQYPSDLHKIICSHRKLHPKNKQIGRTDLSQQKKRFEMIQQILKKMKEISYDDISQILAEEFFLNPMNYTINKQVNALSLGRLLFTLIEPSLPNINRNIFFSQIFIREVAEIIAETVTEEALDKEIPSVQKYNQNLKDFKKAVQKLTLKQYYKITKIELSCTSVDLDSNILRFFNQKTTPDLPVCRAVQMTGSFPVGFKAQKWKNVWKYYFVHYSNTRRVYFLEDHEFTDGGMLANFPIKYFDNNYIRDTYFSHVINKTIDKKQPHPYETIMLGFGLDQLSPQQQTSNQNEVSMIKKKKEELYKAFYQFVQQLKNFLPIDHKISLVVKFWDILKTVRYPKRDQKKWRELPYHLIREIPFLQFAFKFLHAYPRADRNLNLECFQENIYQTQLFSKLKSSEELTDISKSKINIFLSRLPNEISLFLSKSTWAKIKDALWRAPVQNEKSDITNKLKQKLQVDSYFSQEFRDLQMAEKSFIEQATQRENKLQEKEYKEMKRKIKVLLVKVISNLMKLKFTKAEIENQTLNFLSLKYNKKISSLNQLSLNKFKHQNQNQLYDEIEYELPFDQYRKTISKSTSKQREKIIQSKNTYIINKLKSEEKKEFLNLDSFLLTENQNFLIQYIFLSKIREKDLEKANKLLRRVGHLSLLNHFDLTQELTYQSYLTLKDIKSFYRRLFNKSRSLPQEQTQYLYNEKTFLENQDIRNYEFESLKHFNVQQDKPFYSHYTDYNEYMEVNVSIIHAEHLLLKKSFLNKIQFDYKLKEALSQKQVQKQLEKQFQKLIINNQQKYAVDLSTILYGQNEQKILTRQILIELLNSQSTRKDVISLLFNKDGDQFIYSKNKFICQSYQHQYKRIKQGKQFLLEEINKKINQSITNRTQQKYNQLNPLEIQIYYLQDLLQEINVKLLIKRMKNVLVDYSQESQDNHSKRQKLEKDEIKIQKEKCEMKIKMIKMYQSHFNRIQIFLNIIRYKLYLFYNQQNEDVQKSATCKSIKKVAENIGTYFNQIRQQLLNKLNRTVDQPIRTVDNDSINDIFTLQHRSTKLLAKQIFSVVKIIDEIIAFNRDINIHPYLIDQYLQMTKIELLKDFISYYNIFFEQSMIKLPRFRIIYKIYQNEYRYNNFSTMLKKCIMNQINPDFIKAWNDSNKIKLNEIKKNQLNESKKFQLKVHLILEGTDQANQYYAYYYELFEDLKQTSEFHISQKIDVNHKITLQPTIRIVTTSSYHSIFGFLLALATNIDDLKDDLAKIRQISLHFEPKKQVQSYFNSQRWAYNNSSEKCEHWDHIKRQNENIFEEIQKLACKRLGNHDLSGQFKEAKAIYQHEHEKIINYYENMMNEITQQIEVISKTVTPKFQAREISKKYALNYLCDLNNNHEYKHINQRILKVYYVIVQKMFDAYGSLLEGIVTNYCTSEVKINLPNQRASDICKGFLVKQLLTSFRIKDFVIQKLKDNSLKENITLLEFFNHAPKKILLNFTTINVHKARLEFMNKNTLPNMPVWAAIMSASCLPFFYRDFECPREWEYPASDPASFYEYIVDEFFNSRKFEYKKSKYCSGNIISSLPMELLTNQTTLSTMFAYDTESKVEPYLNVGFSFDMNEQDYKNSSHVLKRNYLQAGFIQTIITKYWKLPKENRLKDNCNQNTDKHKTSAYKYISSWKNKLATTIGQSNFKKVFGILVDSNDNFALHSYWDKLVRLPIKIGTLDFQEINNEYLKETYGAVVPSDKVNDAISRSYEITKYFGKQHSGSIDQKYTVIIRVQIITLDSVVYGEEVDFAKIDILSHSKWNRNRYNNFIVSYATDINNFDATSKLAIDSQITWNLSQSSRIHLRFYFPNYDHDPVNNQTYSFIQFSQLEVSLTNIRDRWPLKNSYDYSLNFKKHIPIMDDPTKLIIFDSYDILRPIKKNQIITVEESPLLKVRSWQSANRIHGGMESSQRPVGERAYIRPYVK